MKNGLNLSCRICYKWEISNIDLESPLNLQENERDNDLKEEKLMENVSTYLDCYRFVAQVEVELDEHYANKLCKNCINQLLITYKFMQKIQSAEDTYQRRITTRSDPIDLNEKTDNGIIVSDQIKKTLQNCDKLENNDHVIYFSTNLQSYNVQLTEEENISDGLEVNDNIKIQIEEMDESTNMLESKTYSRKDKSNTQHRKHDFGTLNRKSEACQICGKKFVTKYYMRLHMETHQEERTTYDCDECGRKYYHENSLAMHKRVHTGDLLECDECKRKFVNSRELRVHKNCHNRIYQYVCDICGAQYLRINHLNTHMLRHKGLKAECVECGKLFNSQKGLYEHLFVHSGKMPFNCRICDRGYPSRQKYKVHLQKMHDLELTAEEIQNCLDKLPMQTTKNRKVKWVQVDE